MFSMVAQPDERHANRSASVLEWYDRHRAYLQHLAHTKKCLRTAPTLYSSLFEN